MTAFFRYVSVIALAVLITGCAIQSYVPSNSIRTIPLDGKLTNDAVLEAAVEIAEEVSLPAMTKMDKADGIVEFGGFERTEMGLSAQVRVRPDNKLEIIVKRGSVFFAQNADADADTFKTRLEERLTELEKAGK
jgi:PBP1b-binding outer membrane lipoprotein LpoB